jgi:hypothetical protein
MGFLKRVVLKSRLNEPHPASKINEVLQGMCSTMSETFPEAQYFFEVF